ncbi:MAG: MBL fold metallo-hydrolase [candidate division WOR-3 bacterium]
MNISVLGAESLGIRSYCTFVETQDVKIIIDPGCALGTDRFNLPPHKTEILELWSVWQNINLNLKKSDIVVITHYHYDHHHYRNCGLYRNKIVFLKDFGRVNQRQKSRAEVLLKYIGGISKVIIADEKEFIFGNTRISFSPPLAHGYGKEDVNIMAVLIEDGRSSLLYTSDVSGMIDKKLISFLKNRIVETFILDGFPTYLLNSAVKRKWLYESKEKLIYVLESCKVKNLIIDHHSSRDIRWTEFYLDVFSLKFLNFCGTAAEFMGQKPKYYEAMRKELFSKK